MPTTDFSGQTSTWRGKAFLKATVPSGDNRGKSFTIAQPLAGRYLVVRFFATGGMGLLLEGFDLRTKGKVLIKAILNYDVIPYARVRDQEGFTNQLRLPRKTLEMERRILVLLRNAGCNAVPHPNDFVYDANPQLAGPYATEDRQSWQYDDEEMIVSEPYLIMEAVHGESLEAIVAALPEKKLAEARTLRIFLQVADVLATLHKPVAMKPGMTWQLIYQDLKPSNLVISAQDRVTVLDLGGCQLVNLDTKQKLLPGACTAGYCAPECERPYGILTPAADVYTVGTNLFEMVTGKSPLQFLTTSLGKNQAQAVHLETRMLQGECSPALRNLIEKCLETDPERRFPDAQAILRAIQLILLEG